VDKVYSPEEAGEVLGLSADAIRRLCNDGLIAHTRIGKRKGARIRIRERALEAFMDAHEVPAVDRTNPVLAEIRRRRREAS
jgi:excisionase family DNA binding protein